mmetsp:Transcript_6634/g.14110  ORF Transcript_6634/g.14110 Transcript_6634/m.14110 type:complete len:132 (-) Transcript_6634:23-418(-)
MKTILISRARTIGIPQSLHDILKTPERDIFCKPNRCSFKLIHWQRGPPLTPVQNPFKASHEKIQPRKTKNSDIVNSRLLVESKFAFVLGMTTSLRNLTGKHSLNNSSSSASAMISQLIFENRPFRFWPCVS